MPVDQLVGAGLGLLLGGHEDRRQQRQHKKLGKQQLIFDISKMHEQNKLAKQLYEDTSYPTQMRLMKEAGINPGLMYGMGGSGGITSGGPTSSVGVPSGPKTGGEVLGMQLATAQAELIEAQTQKTTAEAEKISGVDTEEAQTRIKDLTQGIENKKSVRRLTQIQGNIAEIEEDLITDSYNDTLSQIKFTARQTEKQLEILRNDKTISDATINDKIGIVQGELIGLGLTNELKKVQTDLTEKQAKKTVADIAQGWQRLKIQDKTAIANLLNSETAQKNANTRIREYIEQVRRTDLNFDVKNGALQLDKMIKDVPESTRLTVGALSNVFGSITNFFKPNRKPK